MSELSRRALFHRLADPVAGRTAPDIPADGEGCCAAGDPDFDYFGSFAACHTLLAEIRPLMGAEVARLGIDTTGKTDQEIAREIFARQRPPPAVLRATEAGGEEEPAVDRGGSGRSSGSHDNREGEP